MLKWLGPYVVAVVTQVRILVTAMCKNIVTEETFFYMGKQVSLTNPDFTVISYFYVLCTKKWEWKEGKENKEENKDR